jgi:hypothetical protein
MGDNKDQGFPHDPASWVAGLLIGIGLGVVLGLGMANIAAGLVIGIGLGLAFAVVIGAARADARRRRHHVGTHR